LVFTQPGQHFDLQVLHLISRHLMELELVSVEVKESFLNLSGCPALEQLAAEDCDLSLVKRILSVSLKRLSITSCIFSESFRTHIHTPSLVSLLLDDNWCNSPVLESMPSVGTLGPGYPLLLRLGKDSRSYPKLRVEEQSSRTPAVRSPPRRASGPGPALCSGEGPVAPRVPEKAAPGADSRGSPDPHAIRAPRHREPAFHPGGVRSRHVSAGAGTSLPPEDSPTHRI